MPSIYKRQPKLQANSNSCVNILQLVCATFSKAGKLVRFFNNESDLHSHSRSLVRVPFDRPHVTSYYTHELSMVSAQQGLHDRDNYHRSSKIRQTCNACCKANEEFCKKSCTDSAFDKAAEPPEPHLSFA